MSGLEELLTGRTLVKRYRIEEVIGRGGFAVVYRADDERLGRPVAVKVITVTTPDEAAAERHRERFEREARAAASLPQHPNLVTVYDFGIDPELGLDFLVMEFLHGEDLATKLQREGRPSISEALRILRDAAAGIAVGHRAGIVHRDVKPGNIFLARSQESEVSRVCVLDFGIARVLADDETLTHLPGEGTPLSPAYASPEQSRGVRDLTVASDVFSLGVVAFQLLTGEKPFAGPRGADPSEWVPARGIRELNPEVPDWLEAVVLRAIAFTPQDRFADAGEFSLALASAAGIEPVMPAAAVVAPPAPAASESDDTLYQPLSEPPPRADRHRLVFSEAPARRRSTGMAILIALLLVVGAGAGWWLLAGGSGSAAGDPTAADPAAVDPAAVADLEAVNESLQGRDPEPTGSAPARGRRDAESGASGGTGTPTAAQPQLGGAPVAASPGTQEPPASNTQPAQSGAAPAPPAGSAAPAGPPTPADSPAPADTALPPPRVIGVPVDRASESTSPPADNAAGPPGLSEPQQGL